MKRLAVISILTVQLFLLLNKTLTIVHFFLHQEEIIEHFCHHATHAEEQKCQGICYLNDILNEGHQHDSAENFPVNSLVQEEVLFFEMLKDFKIEHTDSISKATNQYIVKSPFFNDFHLSLWRPPANA